MPKRTTAADSRTPVPVNVVIVTMDSHLSTAATRAARTLARDIPGLRLVVHAADEWGRDADALESCRADIATADILVATMLFLEDHVAAVLPALRDRAGQCDAIVGCLAAPDIVKLTRLGKFAMGGEATGALAWLKRLRGSNREGGASGRGQMKMLRQIPRLLRFIPGTAQDVRSYFLCLQYWLAGSDENIAGLVRLLVTRYAVGARATLRTIAAPKAPICYPDVGLYHPALDGRITDRAERMPGRGGQGAGRGTVGLLLMRSYVLAGNTGHYDGVIAALEARGLTVLPAFASGLDARPAIEKFFVRGGRPCVDAVLSLTGFSLVGGPAYNDAKAAETVLQGLDVPYFAAHPVEFQTLAEWEASDSGLLPVEATMMVAIPELDGAVGPVTFGGRAGGDRTADGGRDMVVHHERAAMLAARVARHIALRRTERAERRLAVVLFAFPPNAGNLGTAAYLGVFESLLNVLRGLRDDGYRVTLPESADALRARILDGNAARFGTVANVAARISAEAHVRREPYLREIEAQWGPSPGRAQSDGGGILVLGAEFGHVFVGIQPAFGYEGDPMRLLFERGFAPTHAFSAFYRWLREDFRADAVLHFGTHGALEFMPGKQAGLSGACWPDRLIGDLPNFYLYASNNPSEGLIAKRRSGATLISYLTPAVAKAGLYRGLADLAASVDRWRALPPDADEGQRQQLENLIAAQAEAVDLSAADGVPALHAQLVELQQTLIPHGLHVVGRVPDAQQRREMLEAAGIDDPARFAELDRLLAEDAEIPSILRALDGRYIRPAPGGDLMRTTEVLPTGRNLHGLDPFRLPSRFAVQDGAAQAERLLARHAAVAGGLPRTVAMVLWGTDNLKTEGGPIAQALWLMGAEPRHDSYGRLCGAKLVPLAKLGRPRIDVIMTLSGIFRDLLPLQVKLLAEAAYLAASAEESESDNFVRAHALDFQREHGGDLRQAALRVFGNADGAYGANVNHLLDHGGWQDEDELAQTYLRRKSFAYGTDGRTVRQQAVLTHVLAGVDATYQNLDSVELGVTTVDHYFDTLGGMTRAVRGVRGGEIPVYIGDQTRGDGTVRTLAEQVALETRTRALNPKWYEALLEHGYEGVRQIEAQVTNTLGWSATAGGVAPWVYEQLASTFVLDEAMRERLAALNPTASMRIANRLIEAHERRYWNPDPETRDALRHAGDDLEDRLEGITLGAAA